MLRVVLVFALGLCGVAMVNAQDKGVLSGNLQSQASFFQKNSKIGADESPQYHKQLTSAESWLFLNYQIKGFSLSARYDLFNNSNLLNPTGSFTGHGLGFWQINKKINKLDVTVGSFYDQFGSGLIFRAYEQRLIGIDYAVEGLRAQYNISDNFFIKAFTGRQKGAQSNRFGTEDEILMGANAEKFWPTKNGSFMLGAATVKRTLSDGSMTNVVSEINSYDLPNRFDPKYNVYAFSGYFDFTHKGFNVRGEYVEKSQEAIREIDGKLRPKTGNVLSASANYSKRGLFGKKKSGLGITVQYRRIENFQMRLTPNSQLLNGLISYQPSMTRQASYNLLARYTAQALELGEEAIQAELIYTFNPKHSLGLNYSQIHDLNGNKLFREYYFDYNWKINSKLKIKTGLSSIFYDIDVYQGKVNHDTVMTITPFFDITYRVNRKHSLRLETQYLKTAQDLGSFVNGLLEWNISPHYSFAVSDMINVDPVRKEDSNISDEIIHYYTIFGKYNIKTTSFTLAYIRQVEGVNCTGGICRLEPAFSGVRFTLRTNF